MIDDTLAGRLRAEDFDVRWWQVPATSSTYDDFDAFLAALD